MQEKQVLEFLEQHPDFLQEHAAQFGLRPSLERVISFSERQLLESRDKYRILEAELLLLIANAKKNEKIQQQLQSLTLMLLRAQNIDELAKNLNQLLTDIFMLKNTALRIWHPTALGSICYGATSVECLRQIQNQIEPLNTQYINDELLSWLPQTTVLQSFALLPLRDKSGNSFGLLLLASEEQERFSPQKYNDYLKTLAEQISVKTSLLLNL